MSTSIRRRMAGGMAVLLTPLLLIGCNSGTDSGDNAQRAAPNPTRATALSNHYVEVQFDAPAGATAALAPTYAISGPNATPLAVTSVQLSDDKTSIVLTTDAQEAVEYTLTMRETTTQIPRSYELVRSASAASSSPSVTFTGSLDAAEPTLETAISLNTTSVLLTFSERMDKASAENITFYSIAAPDLQITSAVLSADELTVRLTTSPQAGGLYSIKVTNLKSKIGPGNQGGKLINPLLNTTTFSGIPPVDTTQPRLLSAVSTQDTAVLLSFSEPLADNAADPRNFTICVTSTGPCTADLAVTGAQLNAYQTQVLLTTLPQVTAVTYRVVVDNVRDRATPPPGNLIDPAANAATFTFAGSPAVTSSNTTPRVVGAISTSNATVVVTFSKAMGDSASDASHYSIVQENVNGEVGTLAVTGASFLRPDHTSVQLTTSSQNEVTYRVFVVDVLDVAGNPLTPTGVVPGTTSNPSSVLFAGTPPTHAVAITAVRDTTPGNGTTTIGVGDEITLANGSTVTLSDGNGDGVIDGFVDQNGNGVIDAGDAFRTADVADSDGDGLTDNEELRGRVITVRLTDGTTAQRQVTSSPFSVDTDGDKLTDAVEAQIGTDPRDYDTDNDGIDDNTEFNIILSDAAKQDTDGDSIDDGLEINFFTTSPLLVDSDGDQLSDSQELFERNRNPRVADLPQLAISIGDVQLRLDERYTTTNAQGQTTSITSNSTASLAQSEDRSFVRTDGGIDEVGRGFEGGVRGGISEADPTGLFLQASFTANYHHNQTAQWQTASSSAVSAQQVYENSLAKGRELTNSRSVTREVVGARIDVAITLENASDIAFTATNLEITVLQRSRIDTNRYTPVATLIPNTTLTTGVLAAFTLGGDVQSRGPILFTSRDVFPSQVDELLRDPRGLVFLIANVDIKDEFGRNFVFVNQIARDRTVGVTIDFGPEPTVRHLAAVHGARDTRGVAGGGFVGGFDAQGRALGLPLDYVLQDILQMPKNPGVVITAGPNGIANTTADPRDQQVAQPGTAPGVNAVVVRPGADGILHTKAVVGDRRGTEGGDAIIAGLDRIAESRAQGDDVQLIPPGTTGVGVGSVVVAAGQNGVLDSIPSGDDEVQVTAGYETSLTCSATATNAGDACSADDECSGGTCSGPERLVRVAGWRNGTFNRNWAVFYTGQIPAAASFGTIIVDPGQNIFLAFLQDLDGDGLFAREEFLVGAIDSAADRLNNTLFGDSFDENAPGARVPDGLPDSRDTDRDGLGDFAEVIVGWFVSVDGGPLVKVLSHPGRRDSDGDGLSDLQESDLRNYCNPNNAILSALCVPVTQTQADGIIAGSNGQANTTASGDDVQVVPVGTSGLSFARVIIRPGPNGVIDTVVSGDDAYASTATVPPATDPTRSDTDADEASDKEELVGYTVGLAIIDGSNGIANTRALGDDVQLVGVNQPVAVDGIVILPGPNRRLDSTAALDDELRSGHIVQTNPLRADSDDDFRPDGLERDQGADPTDPNDGADFVDTDADGLTDAEELTLGWKVFVDNRAPYQVFSNPNVPDTDRDGLPDYLERLLGTDPTNPDTDGDSLSDFDEFIRFEEFVRLSELYPGFVLNGSNSQRYGTDPTQRDTDGDSLTDDFELLVGYRFLGRGETRPQQILTSPLLADTDFDGLRDDQERTRGTDATVADTDGDLRSDGTEVALNTDPLEPDIAVTVRFDRIEIDRILEGSEGIDDSEVGWWFLVRHPGAQVLLSDASDLSIPGSSASSGFLGVGSLLDLSSPGVGIPSCNVALVRGQNQSGFTNIHNTFHLNKERTFRLRRGETFTLEGLLGEFEGASRDCGTAPNFLPSSFRSDCYTRFRRTFTFTELSNGGLGGTSIAINPVEDGSGGPVQGTDECSWSILGTVDAR